MKTKNGYFLAVTFGVLACSDKDSLSQETMLDDPKTINVYCQGNPDRLLRTIQFEYRRDGKPIREITSSDHAKMEKSMCTTMQDNPLKRFNMWFIMMVRVSLQRRM